MTELNQQQELMRKQIAQLADKHILKHVEVIEAELGKQKSLNTSPAIALSAIFEATIKISAIAADLLYGSAIDHSRLSESAFLKGATSALIEKYMEIKNNQPTNQDLE